MPRPNGPHRCPSCDPILVAGSLRCGACGAVSYPVAAEWLTGTLILASYDQAHEPGCGRRRTACGVVLLDTAAAVDFIPYVGRPRICRGTTTAGRPCRAFPPPGSGFCHWHDPARVAR